MIKLVIAINLAIALCGFYVAWRLWRAKCALTASVVAVDEWTQAVHRVLNPATAPALIGQGQHAIATLRDRRDRLAAQIQQLQRIYTILRLGLSLLGRRSRPRRPRWRL